MKKAVTYAVMALLFAAIASVSHAGDVEMSGVAFLRYNWQTSKYTRTGVTSQQDRNEFFADRLYLTVKKKYEDGYSVRGTIEALTGNIFLKYLYLEKTGLVPGAKLRFGQSAMPWVGFEEKIWGRRYVSKVAPDLWGYLSSTDIGINMLGKCHNGMVNYHFGIYNGEKYKTGESAGYDGKYKEFHARTSVYPIEGFGIHAYGSIGNTAVGIEKRRLLGGVSYKNDAFHVMGSYMNHRIGVTKDEVFSLHASAKVGNGYVLFARQDLNNDDVRAVNTKVYKTIVGVEKELTKGIKIALSDHYEAPEKEGTSDTAPHKSNYIYLQALVKF